jgi:hypothetical protein
VVRVIRRFRRVAADQLVVELADGLQLAIPAWVLDPVACAPLCVTATPRISLSALRQLRALLDAQALEVGPAPPYAEASPPRGGGDARPQDPAPTTPAL